MTSTDYFSSFCIEGGGDYIKFEQYFNNEIDCIRNDKNEASIGYFLNILFSFVVETSNDGQYLLPTLLTDGCVKVCSAGVTKA